MSRSRHLEAFPSAYLRLAARFEGARAIRRRHVNCGSEREAVRLRLDLYRFKSALRAQGMVGDYPNFMATRLYVHGKQLRVVHADDTLARGL